MVNKAIIVGNLGKDPELRYTPQGTAVASFSVATSEKYKDRDGNRQEKTEWHNIIVWRQLAEICGKYLHKGKQVYLEGKIQNRSYEDRDGNKRYITEIVAHQMQMLGTIQDSGGAPQSSMGARQTPAADHSQGQSRPAGGNYSGYEEPAFDPNDEIPF